MRRKSRIQKKKGWEGLTVFLVQQQLCFVFPLTFQRLVDGLGLCLRGLLPVQELARASFGHDLRSAISGQLAEAVRAVNDGPPRCLRVAQHEIAVCRQGKGGIEERCSLSVCYTRDVSRQGGERMRWDVMRRVL